MENKEIKPEFEDLPEGSYGFGILDEAACIGVAKNLKISGCCNLSSVILSCQPDLLEKVKPYTDITWKLDEKETK